MKLENRKLKEIEHSERRRKIVTGYEYQTDTNINDLKNDYISDSVEYDNYFSNMKYYSITKLSVTYRDNLLFSDIKGKTVLDYCCGNGEIGIKMALQGAKKVHGIDISQAAIINAKSIAKKEKVQKQCKFEVMDAENTKYKDNFFDIIHEYGALHHLDLDASLKELSRIVKPEGKVVCTEALRHNSLIHAYRKKTMHLRTEWEYEHILGVPEILSGKKYFKNVKVRFFHLAALGAVPFRKWFVFQGLVKFLNLIDSIILRIYGLRRMAWIAVITYSEPYKNIKLSMEGEHEK